MDLLGLGYDNDFQLPGFSNDYTAADPNQGVMVQMPDGTFRVFATQPKIFIGDEFEGGWAAAEPGTAEYDHYSSLQERSNLQGIGKVGALVGGAALSGALGGGAGSGSSSGSELVSSAGYGADMGGYGVLAPQAATSGAAGIAAGAPIGDALMAGTGVAASAPYGAIGALGAGQGVSLPGLTPGSVGVNPGSMIPGSANDITVYGQQPATTALANAGGGFVPPSGAAAAGQVTQPISQVPVGPGPGMETAPNGMPTGTSTSGLNPIAPSGLPSGGTDVYVPPVNVPAIEQGPPVSTPNVEQGPPAPTSTGGNGLDMSNWMDLILGGVTSLLGNKAASDAADKATAAQLEMSQKGLDYAKETRDMIFAQQEPFRLAAEKATGALTDMTGLTQNGYNWQTDPGYQWRMDEGMKALENSAAAKGGLLSGGFGQQALRYAQDYSSQEYTNVYNRVANIAGMNQVSGPINANAASNYGATATGQMNQMGQARASGYTAIGNANATTLNQLSEAFGGLDWNKIFGKGP